MSKPLCGRMRGRILVLVVVCLVSSILFPGPGGNQAWAQTAGGKDWNQEYDPYYAAVGLVGGYSSGTGLSIRWPAFKQTMMSLSGAIWSSGGKASWNLGLELHLVLRQMHRTRLYTGPAFAVYRDGDDSESTWNASFNVGVEYLLWARVALKGDIGFTYRNDQEDILPLPNLGVYYYF